MGLAVNMPIALAPGMGLNAIFGGLLFTAAAGAWFGFVRVEGAWFRWGAWSLPGLQMDLPGALSVDLVFLGVALQFFAVFDTMGTLYAVGSEAGLLDDGGNFPQLGRTLSVDTAGAVALLSTDPYAPSYSPVSPCPSPPAAMWRSPS